MRRICWNEVWSHHSLIKLLCLSACTSTCFLPVCAPLYRCLIFISCITDLSGALIAPGVYSEQLIKTACSGAPYSEKCVHTAEQANQLYKALIRILFSQSPAYTGGLGTVYRACTVGLKASVCAFKTFGVNIKHLGDSLKQTSEEILLSIWNEMLSTGKVLVSGSCLDSGGQSICYSLKQGLLCLH